MNPRVSLGVQDDGRAETPAAFHGAVRGARIHVDRAPVALRLGAGAVDIQAVEVDERRLRRVDIDVAGEALEARTDRRFGGTGDGRSADSNQHDVGGDIRQCRIIRSGVRAEVGDDVPGGDPRARGIGFVDDSRVGHVVADLERHHAFRVGCVRRDRRVRPRHRVDHREAAWRADVTRAILLRAPWVVGDGARNAHRHAHFVAYRRVALIDREAHVG